MSIIIDVGAFFESHPLPIIDVRSPGEFGHGHIPGANNVPLLDDAERAEVGTIYKQIGHEQAITRGRELVGSKTDQLVDSVKAIATGPDLVVHCWRGGMRSEGFAGLLEQCGWKPRLLQGGYKAFRQSAHRCFAETRRIIILGGHSGAGKTRLLNALKDNGEQVIDLERLANHRGSVFGGINQPTQPTVEQFENQLFLQWRDLDPDKPVWIEGESQVIGRVFIPQPVWLQMAGAPAIMVEVDRRRRVEFLVQEYGDLPADELATAIGRIKKRLGGARLQAALAALERRDLHTFAELALEYYDKAYSNCLQMHPRDQMVHVPLSTPGESESMETLSRLASELTADN